MIIVWRWSSTRTPNRPGRVHHVGGSIPSVHRQRLDVWRLDDADGPRKAMLRGELPAGPGLARASAFGPADGDEAGCLRRVVGAAEVPELRLGTAGGSDLQHQFRNPGDSPPLR